MTKLGDEPTEVAQALTQDLLTFNFTFVRKSERQIRQTNPTVRTVTVIEKPSERFAHTEC